MVQRVKDLALSLKWFWSLLWCGFDPGLGTSVKKKKGSDSCIFPFLSPYVIKSKMPHPNFRDTKMPERKKELFRIEGIQHSSCFPD